MKYSIKHPRRVFIRNGFRALGRGALPLLSQTRISGMGNFPKQGPLIVIGNHTGAMEVVLMGVYSPQPLEFMGSVEIPWNGWMGKIVALYELIPVYRGYTNTQTLKMGVDVLRQGGMLGLFPEGGFWEPGKQKAQTGAAWLSYMAQAPVLPIGFGNTRGKMAALFQGKRPTFEMNIGEVLPPVQLDNGLSKKEALQQAADRLMEAVWALIPAEERQRKESRPENERFSFHIQVFDSAGQLVEVPPGLRLDDGAWISRFAHRPNLINTIRDYVFIPVQVLKELDRQPPAEEIFKAAQSMVAYVENENPQYFNYRYGYQDGQAFLHSFRQLRDLLQWVLDHDFQVQAEVRYQYQHPHNGETHTLHVPEEVQQW